MRRIIKTMSKNQDISSGINVTLKQQLLAVLKTSDASDEPSGLLHQMKTITPTKQFDNINLGGSMADLSGYKDLSKAPVAFGDDDLPISVMSPESTFDRIQHHPA